MTASDDLVLVIGGSSGTGRAIVQLLHGRGVKTRIMSRDPVRWLRSIIHRRHERRSK